MKKYGYKNCVYDRFNKCIWLKEIHDVDFKKIPFEFDYYAPDPSGTSPIKDIHGRPIKRHTAADRAAIKQLVDSGVKLVESDLSEVVKFLHERYDAFADHLDTSSDNFRKCYYDIETQTSCIQDRRSIVKVKRVDTGEELEGVLNDLDDFVHTNDYLWWDDDTQAYVKFNESCYFLSEFPKPSEAKFPINLLTCYSTVTNQSYTWGLFEYTGNDNNVTNYRWFEDEYEMMCDWAKWFAKQKFDIFTGWNSDGFDLEYIITRIKNLEEARGIEEKDSIAKKLSPLNKQPFVRSVVDKKGVATGTAINVPGLYTMDYMLLYKKFLYANYPSYALNYVGNLELGEGKLDYEGQIYETYKRNWNRYVEYNVQDVKLIVKIEAKRKVFQIMIPYCIDCMITLDKYSSMIAGVEGYILKFLHQRNIRLNDIDAASRYDWWKHEGLYKVVDKDGNITYQNCEYEKEIYEFDDFAVKAGYCYACPGRYKWVISGDIQSSYPHQIMMYNISPEVKVIKPTKEQIESGEVIQSEINGVGFKRTDNALLPDIIRQVFAERLDAKAKMKAARDAGNADEDAYWDFKQASKKLIINSCYGVCLNANFHLFDIDCARAITRGGRDTIRFLRDCNNRYYTSKTMIKDLKKYFPIIKIELENDTKYYKFDDKIPVIRNGELMEVVPADFNETTDLVCLTKEEDAEHASNVVRYNFDIEPIKVKRREGAIIQIDTDSNYICFEELKEEVFPDMDGFVWFDALEAMLQDMWARALQIRADKKHIPQLIKFCRENMFYGFFSYAKKLYIGSIVDNEGERYSFEEYHRKIKGIVLQKNEFPEFCKQFATPLAFDIMHGLTREEAMQKIIKLFNDFKNHAVDEICSHRTISNYEKYVKHKIDWYLKNGLQFEKGMPANVKMGLAYNYVCAKNKLVLDPIDRGTKFNYIFLNKNIYNIDCIGYVGAWPDEFNKYFTIDYETAFRKFFLAVFESMFAVLGWIKRGEEIQLKVTTNVNRFIKRG